MTDSVIRFRHLLVCTVLSTVGFSQCSYAFENWLTLRDAGIVKQQYDYSCGAAALATILTYFYSDPVSERTLLEQLIKQQGEGDPDASRLTGLSFSEMATLLRARRYTVVGAVVSFADLKKLTVPVVVAMTIEGRGHFSVLRRVDEHDRVFLADPSWGNRQLGRGEFLQSFAINGEEGGHVLIVGARKGATGDDAFRYRPPRRALMSPAY